MAAQYGIEGLWISGEYPTNFPKQNSIDVYWYDIAIGSLEKRYLTAGWSQWKWASGSALGDRMNVKSSWKKAESFGSLISELHKQIIGDH